MVLNCQYPVHGIIVSDISPKLDSLGYIFGRRKFRYIFNHFYAIRPKAAKIGKITQNKGHFAAQGYSRSPILAPIESSYATSYQSSILTYRLSCTVSKIWPVIA